MSASIFGPLIDSADVERRLLDHLEAWMPTTVPFAQRAKDPEGKVFQQAVEEIRSFTVRHMAMEKWPEDQLPMLLAYCPGMDDEPTQNGDGTMDARYGVLILAVSSGFDTDEARELARLYASAVTLAVMQDPSLKAGSKDVADAFAEGVHLGQVTNYPVTRGVEADRFLSAVSMPFTIEVAGILDTSGGPIVPLEHPETEPPPHPHVKEGGGSVVVGPGEAAVQALRDGGFFGDDGELEPPS